MDLFKVSASSPVPKGRFDSSSWSERTVSASLQIDALGQIQVFRSSLRVASVQSISVPGAVLPVHSFASWKSRMAQFESMCSDRCTHLWVRNGIVE